MSYLGPIQRNLLRQRFRKVILSAGYSEEAAQSILAKYFEEYLKDLPKFTAMMAEYERN